MRMNGCKRCWAEFCVRIYKHVRLQPVVRAVTDASEIIAVGFSVLNPCVIVRSTYASIHLILLYACYIDVTGQHRATPWRNTQTSKEDVPLKRRSQEGRQESSSSLFMFTVALTQNCLTASHFWMSRCFSECQDLLIFRITSSFHVVLSRFCPVLPGYFYIVRTKKYQMYGCLPWSRGV